MLSIDIIRESPLWEADTSAERTLRRALQEAARAVSTSAAELAIVLTDDSRIRELNRAWRGIDKPTNVLSFAAAKAPADGPALLGDIVIAFETTAREAEQESKPFAHHLAHLAVHGFLHLLGYDHESDAQAEDMERRERAILARLDVPDPFLAREG